MQPHLIAEAFIWRDEIVYSMRMYDPDYRVNGDMPPVKKIEGKQPQIAGLLPDNYGSVLVLMLASFFRLVANESPQAKAVCRDTLQKLLDLDFGTDSITV